MVTNTANDPGDTLERTAPITLDETANAEPAVRELYSKVQHALMTQEQESLASLTAKSQRLMRDLGVTFALYGEDASRDHVVPFDPFPRIISSGEWRSLASGVAQRMKVWNAFFKDIYGPQEILKAEVLPFELVFDDPHYQRVAVGVPVPQNIYAHAGAFDLARNEHGEWVVIDDYVSTTAGVSYALQSRHVLSKVCPDLLRLADVRPNYGYPTELLEHLRRFSPGTSSEPRVVLLAPGIYDNAYYEYSYLARQMGVPLVRGGDLIVLNTRVYLKTIGGLEPIDVIYRLLDDRSMDPLALARDDYFGVPGLMSCVRKGRVAVANAIGTGLGDNRAIAAYLPRMARFYFNEKLLLPSIKRLLCFDPDQCEQVLSNLRDYWIASLGEHANQRVWHAMNLDDAEMEKLRESIYVRPSSFVAEPYMPLSLLPSCRDGNIVPRHAGLRVFTFGERPSLYPCALTRVSPEPGSRIISSGLGGGIKDVWILRGAADAKIEAPTITSSPQRRLRLGSRIAESLYWMGRYAERAENTTRILKALQWVQLEDVSHQDPQGWAPLWEALASATGHNTQFFKRSALVRKESVAHYILLDRNNPSSVISCIDRCRHNVQATRESIPPEVWAVINHLGQLLQDALPTARKKLSDRDEAGKISELQEQLLNQFDALDGSIAKNMLRDDGRHFWSLGLHVERASTTLLVMRQVFLKRQGESALGQREDLNLEALLRMLACLYAYRSLFQARPVAANVARMLMQDRQVSRSVAHCLENICDTLNQVFGDWTDHSKSTAAKQCARLTAEVSFADLEIYFDPDAKVKGVTFPRWLRELADKLKTLSGAISDQYLYHQAINVLR